MQCGEKDPFVDDTVIFAGRVREAKRARKVELDLLLAGKSARFGEGMQMSVAEGSAGIDGSRSVALKRERDQLERGEEEWVQMVLFSDWSHGYLQMGSLMREARAVIDELGDWIDDAFERYAGNGINEATGASASAGGVGINASTRMGGKERWKGNAGKGTRGRRVSWLTSETEETEDDGSAITFVARKHAREAVGTETEVGRMVDGTSSGSEGTAVQEDQRSGGEVPGGKVAGRGGHTISETEMIRRRRLLG